LILTEINMTVGREYMLVKPGRPSLPKQFIDTQIIPMGVNIAGAVEVALDRAAARTGVRPSVILMGAVGLACLGVAGWVRSRERHRLPPLRRRA
jgi:hypothetical protein